MENSDKISDIENTDKEAFSIYGYIKKNWKNILIFILIIIAVIFYIWHTVAIKSTEKRMTEKYDSLYHYAEEFVNTQNNYIMDLLAHTFSLAVIGEISRSNYENVNLYATAMVKKDSKIIEIIVSDEQDKILVSTNKVHENRTLLEYFPFNYLNLKSTSVIPLEEKPYHLIITPLFLFNQQKGFLIIKYSAIPFNK